MTTQFFWKQMRLIQKYDAEILTKFDT